MKRITFSAVAGALLLTLISSMHGAQAQAKGDKVVSRDELRACMDSESDLATRRKALEERRGKNNEEAVAIKAEATELSAEQKRAEESSSGMGQRERFERKVRAHNARVKAQQAGTESLQADYEGLNKSLVAHNDKCGGISYSKEDKEAILKEREGKK
ncbi:hypothetical protein GCM10027034_39440 [Ramlibacter solisilvae]|uniref:Uncharacterized protein n=1 Tax=Ramlibacter tataouinensis TaxID=94132 RepID=A0A127JU88_9BURK|nr:hypothetical protein [Ramlibacter tataouinensis]AMO23540.1 hypothetical protein UC35_12350 [Ramlibacter tataouinensis]